MTVNDAPALKLADIGVAMGRAGTDVAKEAADVILVDDALGTLIPAVEEGKAIFANVRNFLAFQLSTAAAALSLITISSLGGRAAPLNAMQILFINIIMDGAFATYMSYASVVLRSGHSFFPIVGPPSQSLGVDPPDPAIMRRPPRRKDEPILTRPLMMRVAFSATIVALGTLFIYGYALGDAHVSRREQTMVSRRHLFTASLQYVLLTRVFLRRSPPLSSSTSYPQFRTEGSDVRSMGTRCCSPLSALPPLRSWRSCTWLHCRQYFRRRRSGPMIWVYCSCWRHAPLLCMRAGGDGSASGRGRRDGLMWWRRWHRCRLTAHVRMNQSMEDVPS
jgi:magnesium-transporting ATPase (P-type)